MGFDPPVCPPGRLAEALCEAGHAVLAPEGLAAMLAAQRPGGRGVQALDAWRPSWDLLAPDAYLRDGGRYRRRRHSCFVVEGDAVLQVPHRAHWQPLEYNALHGGLERWFEPIDAALLADPAWSTLLATLARACSAVRAAPRWHVEVHQFRIDTTDGIGRPTPEGAHRDGVDFVAVVLVSRWRVKGGETRVFDAAGPHGIRFTMTRPWTVVLLDDTRVIHETTPIQPADAAVADGHRDTLVLTFRAAGFQSA